MNENRSKLVYTAALLVAFIAFWWFHTPQRAVEQAESAPSQLSEDAEAFTDYQDLQRDLTGTVVSVLFIVGLGVIWGPVLYQSYRRSKKSNMLGMTLLLGLFLLLSACKPYAVKPIEEIQPNETAFVVPLIGDTGQQEQLQSIKYLRDHQVAAKQIEIPVREHRLGRMPWNVEYIPTVKVIRVDRSPVSREWTSADDTGTAIANQAFGVESYDGVDFEVGATCSTIVEEENAAEFLYYFAGKSLAQVMDSNIRSFVFSQLFDEFGRLKTDQGPKEKADIFKRVFERTRDEFEPFGITILSLGGSEGLIYTDPSVQAAINANFEAQQEQIRAGSRKSAQKIENEILVDKAKAEAEAALIAAETEAEALRVKGEQLGKYPGLVDFEIARKSRGEVPNTIVITGESGNNLPFAFLLEEQASE